MLTLERKDGEAILIQHQDQELRIKFRQGKAGRIKVDFDGPEDFVILREELNKD